MTALIYAPLLAVRFQNCLILSKLRHMRWLRAMVAVVVGWMTVFLIAEVCIDGLQGIYRALRATYGVSSYVARGFLLSALATPGIIAALLVYGLHNRTTDEYPRCAECGYILHGLTEPRCPECGTSI